MEKVIINSYEEFEKLVGQQIGVSEWLEIPQERINQFADATLDHQWIHVDAERAKVESPYKSTIREFGISLKQNQLFCMFNGISLQCFRLIVIKAICCQRCNQIH